MRLAKLEFFARSALVLALLMFAGIGFNGYKDIDKRFFVVSMGVDEGKNGFLYEVTLKLALPQADPKAAKNEFLLIKRESNSIGEAVAFMKSQVDKEFDFGHMKMIFIGESLAKRNWLKTMDWFFRRRDIQKIAYVAVARPDAATALNIKPMFEQLPSSSLFTAFGDEGSETPYIVTEYLFDLHRRLHERGIDPVVPIVEPYKKQFDIQKAYIVTRSGIKTALNPQETGLYSMLLNRAERATLSVQRGTDSFSVTADEIKLDHELRTGAKPTVTVKGTVLGTVEVASETVEPSELGKFESALEQRMNEDIISLLKKLQEDDVDPFGFGLHYRATHYNNDTEWEDWRKIYPKLTFESEIRVVLETPGVVE
ncbi:Ger(x)C family spore germination C-terminal domain-containing protein [Paenibacillus sp.]|uniref:Ger(x)C family spore germination protein n=1 Tax=Paenibacillus sp. TaxID=58172 RepID=UPI002810E3D9|nr:Ger(x)C family spore germination C-terminal domain-containing protein [Paenibacillus sp.]